MRKLFTAFVMFVTIAAVPAKAQDLEDVLKDHFDAIGQKHVKKVETLTSIGKINQSGLEIPFKQITARPSNFRVEGTFQGLTFVQVFNGKEGWVVNPFAGSTDAQPIPEDQLKGLELQADMDGMLYNWKDKGHTVVLGANQDVEGTACFTVELTTKEGDKYVFFIDAESYLLIKTHTKTTMNGQEAESDTYFSNYMEVEGMVLPGKIENRYNNVTGEVIVIDKYEVNLPYESKLFEKPESTPAPASGNN